MKRMEKLLMLNCWFHFTKTINKLNEKQEKVRKVKKDFT